MLSDVAYRDSDVISMKRTNILVKLIISINKVYSKGNLKGMCY